MKRILLIVIIAAAVLLIACFLFRNLFGEFAGIQKQALVSFHMGSGGDMNGSSHNIDVKAYDDSHALITVSGKDWYFKDPEISEYLVDIAVLEEIRSVFLKYHMQNWDNKEFSKVFVADGASYSYGFYFEEASVGFSSQSYPYKYFKKLSEFDDIVSRYIDSAELLPGLILPERSDGEMAMAYMPDDGQISLSVYEYSEGYLYYRVSNGTDENIEIERGYVLRREGESEAVSEGGTSSYKWTIYAKRADDDSFELPSRLEPGKYSLTVDSLSCVFEIGFADDAQ